MGFAHTYASKRSKIALHQVWYPIVMIRAPRRAAMDMNKLNTTSTNAQRNVLGRIKNKTKSSK